MDSSSIDHVNGNPKFVNTRYFREAAIGYKKNGGKYITAPIGSKEWWEWWEEQEKRCLEGYTVGGVSVTGRHYFYMNFSQLRKMDDDLRGQKVGYKDWDFPAFFEIDYDWYWYKEIAWWGCTPEQLAKLHLWRNPTYLGGGRHLSCAKTRRAGFSFKEANDGVYCYHFIDGSKSYYFAAIEGYLISDGILNKVEYNLDFLNQNTDGWFLKNRMQNSTLMHQMATYKDKKGNIKGTRSEIIGVIINDPDKVRGKEGVKIVYEEAGSFKNLKRALSISVPSISEGSTLTGQISVFGTGGEEKGTDIEGLQDVFENPNDPVFRMLPFKNDWQEGFGASECGVFIPYYMANPTYMDLDGNVDVKRAIADETVIRNTLRKDRDQKKYDLRIAEFPEIPSDAFVRIQKNGFPIGEVLMQKQRVLMSREIQGSIDYGDLVQGSEGLVFQRKPKSEARPIDYYPHKNDDDLTSCITVIEEPQFTVIDTETPDGRILKKNVIPEDVYLLVVDPYYKDDAEDKTSLGSVKVIKQKNRYFNDITDREVAWYTGRPGRTDNFYEIVLKLADWYNGKVQSEIAGGGKGLLDYARLKKKLHRLHFEPVLINGTEMEKIAKNRSYFMDISTDDKKDGLEYYISWLKTPVGLDENGNEIWNLHYIYDVGTLDECLKFNDKDNFDRISSWVVAMFMLKEHKLESAKKRKEKVNKVVGKRILFSNAEQNTSGLSKLTFKDGEVYI
jgi:hypothetical protein